MKAIFLLFFVIAAYCIAVNGSPIDEIPKGISNYKLGRLDDLRKVASQVKAMGLTPDELSELQKIIMSNLKPNATVLTLENKDPNYILAYGGITIDFESGKEADYKFLNRTGKAMYIVNGNKITGTNTLDNGAVTELEYIFNGREASVNRKTTTGVSEIKLVQK
ncbi:unnamed protein product [Orchesella dallaii]|uniref:Uncharacterized protein n=1 Tax=Orchesella dallaii TaxID=48710 RepID=A0ABP1Q349_9HEXA